MLPGIDVSVHNGIINWHKVKASGKSFVIIRAGWAGYEGYIKIDTNFHSNMLGALAAGLDVGVYLYTYAKNPDAARIAAQEVLKLVAPYKLTYPICFDVEETTDKCLIWQGKSKLTQTVDAFLKEIEAAKYYGILYSYTSFLLSYLDMNKLSVYDVWVADYRDQTGTKCPYNGKVGIWQYCGETGRCDGVNGACDLNIAYKDYAAIIAKAGLNSLGTANVPQEPDYAALYRAEKQECQQLKNTVEDLETTLQVVTEELEALIKKLT